MTKTRSITLAAAAFIGLTAIAAGSAVTQELLRGNQSDVVGLAASHHYCGPAQLVASPPGGVVLHGEDCVS